MEPVVSTEPEVVAEKKLIFRTYRVIWYILGIIEIILFFRFLFKVTGANPGSGFVAMIYGLSLPFILPFWGIYQTTVVSGKVFEWWSLVAMLVYFILALMLVRFFHVVKPVNRKEVERKVEEL